MLFLVEKYTFPPILHFCLKRRQKTRPWPFFFWGGGGGGGKLYTMITPRLLNQFKLKLSGVIILDATVETRLTAS